MSRRSHKPGTVILDMLRSARSRRRTSRSLIDAAELFGFTENTTRVTLSRLMARGLIESPERGLYQLSSQTDALNEFVERWRLGEQRVRPWHPERWLFGHLQGEIAKSTWVLEALGFREIRPALHARPDNLSLERTELRAIATSLGLDPGVLLIAGSPDSPEVSQRWLKAWHPNRLDDDYADALQRLQASARHLPTQPADKARMECFALGGEVIHLLAKDPLLPKECVDVRAREQLWCAMLDYDRQGKEIWAAGKGDALRHMPRPGIEAIR